MLSLQKLAYIDQLITNYSILEIRKQFCKEDISELIVNSEMKIMVDTAMVLVESTKAKNRNRVLKIATIIPQITIEEKYIFACRALLSKIKNYPTIKVIENDASKYYWEKTPVMERIREIYEKDSNSICVAGERYSISDIQANLYQMYEDYENISVSAPTSIGKSFLFTRLMINELIVNDKSLVYVVPTRALINQILTDTVEELKKLNLLEKYFVTSSSDTQKIDKHKKGIFVLTQERFYQLCNLGDIEIGMLIIDEAQNIMDESRGVLLEYSIKYAKRVWENIKLIFISPFVENPEILLEKFNIQKKSKGYCEEKTTVRQNIIKLEMEPRGYRVRFENEVIKNQLPIVRSNGTVSTIVSAYEKFNNGNNSIIYCNKPQMAINVCTEIMERGLLEKTEDEELLNFAEFIEQFINRYYLLAKFVRYGMAFHYGSLPAFIRIGIEELAAKGKFKILACTPTLLQGINIPAQNIYIYNPKKNNDLLSNLDFWNLAGRAGRMSYDLDGNVILIDNKGWDDIDEFDKKETFIKCATELDFEKSKIFSNIVENETYIPNKEMKKEMVVYLESGLIFDRISKSSNNVILEGLSDKQKQTVFDKISDVVENFEPPKELLIKLLGVPHKNIENLWTFFRKNDEKIEEYIIGHPMAKKTYIRNANKEFDILYDNMLTIINEYLMDGELYPTEPSKRRLSAISRIWMREIPLNQIIFYRFKQIKDEKAITKKVSDETKYINDNVRFRLVQSIYAYQEILKEYLKVSQKEQLIEKLVNIPMYLEIGACKDSTVELISMGLARELAVELVKCCNIDEKDIRNSLKHVNLELIPNQYAKKRIKEFIVNFA